MVPQSLDTLIDKTARDTFILHNDSKKLFIKVIPLLGVISVILFEIFRHINLPLGVIFPIGIIFTWGPVILMFMHRANQGYIEFDSVQRCLTVYTKSAAKEFRKIPYDQLVMRYEVQKGSKSPDCLDFCISSEKEPLYRLYLDSKQQWMYDEVLSFVREITKGQIKEEIADIKVNTGSLDLAFGILITLSFFILFAAILFGTPFFVAWFFNTGIAGGTMTLLFLFMILIAMNFKLGMQSKKWPSVKGRIISSAVNEHRSTSSSGGTSSTSWKPQVEYSYFVDGREYKCKTLAFYDISFSNFEAGTKFIEDYQAGTIIPIHYQPNRPAVATLTTGIDKTSVVFLILFGIGSVVAAFFAFHNWEGMKWERFADEMPFIYEIAKKLFLR